MANLIKINEVRRRLMHNITRNVGRSHSNRNSTPIDPHKITQILISRPNDRLGNLLLITPLLQELAETFPNCQIDLFVRGGVAPIVFANYDFVDRIIMLPKRPFSDLFVYLKRWLSIRDKKYDLVVNVEKNSSSGRLSTMFAKSKYKFFGEANEGLAEQYPDYTHIAKYPVYNLRAFLTTLGLPASDQPVPFLNIKLSSTEVEQGAVLLQDIVQNEKKTIAIFTFATGNKCYSEDWWADFYGQLKTNFRDYNIIEILPMHNASQIHFEAPTFYSKDVREMASVIANTDLFIGADSGIMHLAASADTPTVGLFSVTNIHKYKPYNTGSFAINTNEMSFSGMISAIDKLLKILLIISQSA